MRPFDLPEYDDQFVDRHIQAAERRSLGQPADGPDQGDDTTLSEVLRKILDRLFPPSQQTVFTVRVESLSPELRHVASLLHLVREGLRVGLTEIIILALVHASPDGGAQLIAMCVVFCVCAAAYELIIRHEGRDTLFRVGLVVCLVLLMIGRPQDATALFYLCCMAIALWQLWSWGVQISPGAWLQRAALAVAGLALARMLSVPVAIDLRHQLVAACAFFYANVVLTNPVCWCFEAWMRANRRLPLAAIRSSTKASRAQGHSSVNNVVLRLGMSVTTAMWMAAVVGFMGRLERSPPELKEKLISVCILFAQLLAFHVGHWLFTELAFHRRSPRPTTCIRSWYVAWRALTTWISYLPPLRAPQVFQFERPWSNVQIRLFVLSLALITNSAFALKIGWKLIEMPAGAAEQNMSTSEMPSAPVSTESPPESPVGLGVAVWVLGIVYVCLAPGLILWLAFAAIWGPLLTAVHDVYETGAPLV